MVGDLVFYSTLNRHTTAVGAATGRAVWTVHKGKFNPVITDGRYIFLNGQTSLFAYDLQARHGPGRGGPGRPPEDPAAQARPRAPRAGAQGSPGLTPAAPR